MRDPSSARSSVRWSDFDLTESSIRHHVADGMQLTHLGVVYDNIMSCVIDEDGVITKVRFLGMDDDEQEDDSPLARLDAGFVLLTGTVRRMLADLGKALGGLA
jgi:recombination associated protein RdgC